MAFFEDQCIAKGDSKDFEKVEGDALKYLDSLGKEREEKETEKKKKSATHIVTPNGVKGEILSRTTGLWEEQEVTVRFENGRIATFVAHGGSDKDFEYRVEAKDAPNLYAEYFTKRLDEPVNGSKESLAARLDDLDGIIAEASAHLLKGASYSDTHTLNGFVLQAEHEKLEVKEALDHLEDVDAEAFAPPAPFDYGVAEQADLGRAKGDTWLDNTVDEMIAENEGQDFDRILNEDPGQIVTEMETPALSDSGVTRELAIAHIMGKTAGFAGPEVDSYRDQFIAKTEIARRDELASRLEAGFKAEKTAAADEENVDDLPDAALFL